MKRRITIFVAAVFLAMGLAQIVLAGDYRHGRTYEVTITNITRGQVFSPPVVISHKWGFRLFELGAPAADWLFPLAAPSGLAGCTRQPGAGAGDASGKETNW